MERTLLTALIVACIGATYLLMHSGWRRSAQRASHIPEPGELLASPVVAGPWDGRFLGTTFAGRWLDRVNAHTLGSRSDARMSLTSAGINVERTGARSFGIPSQDVVEVRADSGIAGRAYERGGIVVVGFRLGEDVLEFGVRFPDTQQHVQALTMLGAPEVSR